MLPVRTFDKEGDRPSSPSPDVQTSEDADIDFYVSTTNRISRFQGTPNGSHVVLSWSTPSETGNAGFDVQRRADGEWTTLGSVAGAGTTDVPQSYEYTTEALPFGVHQFRLRQRDVDGDVQFSDTITTRVRPATVSDVEAAVEGHQVRLLFTAPAAAESATFDVQHWNDEEWVSLGAATPEQNDADGARSYTYLTDRLPSDLHRFRLRQTDRDGSVHYSEPVSAQTPEFSELSGLQAAADGNRVLLSWETSSNTDGTRSKAAGAQFAIQHWEDEQWATRGSVKRSSSADAARSYEYPVEDLSPGSHRFRLRQTSSDGDVQHSAPVTVTVEIDAPIQLSPPSPHPVRSTATATFAVRSPVRTRLVLYNILGRRVAVLYDGTPPASERQTVRLSADDYASGAYFLRLTTPNHSRTCRLTVVR